MDRYTLQLEDRQAYAQKDPQTQAHVIAAIDTVCTRLEVYLNNIREDDTDSPSRPLRELQFQCERQGLNQLGTHLHLQIDWLDDTTDTMPLKQLITLYSDLNVISGQLRAEHNEKHGQPKSWRVIPATEPVSTQGQTLRQQLRHAARELQRFGKPNYDRMGMLCAMVDYLSTLPHHHRLALHDHCSGSRKEALHLPRDVQATLGEFLKIGRVKTMLAGCLERSIDQGIALQTNIEAMLSRIDQPLFGRIIGA